ncbi:MAG TPA: long-chain fatty acid--CoA ligase [Acidobacteriota bacterium]|nr:long-chain fatty acid--CoA ligase [Acidobacteriota bacterium]
MKPLHEAYNSLGEMIRGSSTQWGEKSAVIFQGQSTSYAVLEQMSNQFANALSRSGIGRGDHVALYCINSPWFIAAYFGIVKTGAAVVPINLLLNPKEVQYILSDSGASGLIYFDAFEPNLVAIGDSLTDLKELIVIGKPQSLEARPLTDVVATELPTFDIASADQKQDTAAVIYTSGTTGQPKGAMLTHRNLLHNVYSVVRALPIEHEDVFIAVLPMFHSFGATACMMTPLSAGATVAAVPRFSPDEVGDTIVSTRATVFLGVPSMYTVFANVREDRKPDFSSLRFCISGGAALPGEVMKRFEEKYNVPILEGDGPTECSPVTSVNPFKGARKPGSIGLPVLGVEMRIVDEAGVELSTGDVGEIVVRGENVMKGYLNRPEETAEAFFGDWYRTGDVGYKDEDGYFYIVDRKKELIIVNGMNVYPRMVEEVLYKHPAVAEAAVVPEPNKLHGEVPRAVISLKPEMTATREEIIRLCKEHLGTHQLPRIIEFVQELPKTPTGKILKRALVRKGEVERGVDLG